MVEGAYFTPDPGEITHHLDRASIPNWVGTDQVPTCELEGGR